MERRTSPLARVFAVAAIAVAAIVLIVVVAGSLSGGGSSAPPLPGASHRASPSRGRRTTAATYEVKSGDTLISIAHKTGVPVWKIEELNPEIDPQILIAGERLKLR